MYIKFLWSLLRHKWFVFIECCKLGIPWLGIIHDWTKFLPSEFIPYARHFYGDYPKRADIHGDMRNILSDRYTAEGVKAAFDVAWLHHQKRNRHHWQYWLLQYDESERWEVFGADVYPAEIMCEGKKTGVMEDRAAEPNSLWIYNAPIIEIVKQLNLAPVALPMPDRYCREMLADWRGAGRAYGNPDTAAWYKDRRDKIILHPQTRAWIERKLFQK